MQYHKIFDGKFTLSVKPAAVRRFEIKWQTFAELPKAHIVTCWDGKQHLSHPRAGNLIDPTSEFPKLHCSTAFYSELTPTGEPVADPDGRRCARCSKTEEKYKILTGKNPDANYVIVIREYRIEGLTGEAVTAKNANFRLSTERRENKWKLQSKTPAIVGRVYRSDRFPLKEATAALFRIPVEAVNLEEAAVLWREIGFQVADFKSRKKPTSLHEFLKAVPDTLEIPVEETNAAETVDKLKSFEENGFSVEKLRELRIRAGDEFLTAEKTRFLELLGWLEAHKVKLTANEKVSVRIEKIAQLRECLSSLRDEEWQILAGLYSEFC